MKLSLAVCGTCYTNLVVLNLTPLVIFGEWYGTNYKLRSKHSYVLTIDERKC